MTQQKHKSSLGTKLVSGGIAGVVGTSIIYPMDFIKTKLQTSHSSGILQVARRTIAESGFLGLYKGLAPNLVGIIPEKAIKLAVNDYCREFWGFRLSVNPDKLPLAYGMLSGAFAGCCQVIVTNPMEIVKIRMQTGQGSSVLSVVRELGLRGLYHHSLATLCRDVPFSFVFFPSVAIFKDWLTKDREPQLWSTFTSGILSGALAAACVTPMDVVKSRLQLKDSPYKNMSDCYRKIIQQEGPKALFKGTLPRVLIVSPLFAITVLVYEIQQRFLSYFPAKCLNLSIQQSKSEFHQNSRKS
ncbi:mitochondrial carrier domain-containing protein [Gorgonomyces haynaldii]|nr:mitochondrial carrier domain-containing protein [Gorgonomyces haynaldii]